VSSLVGVTQHAQLEVLHLHALQGMVLYMMFFFYLLRNRHRNILPVTFHCSGDISVTAMLVFVIIERHRMV